MSKFNKFFNKDELISSLAGTSWEHAVEAFRLRLIGWWIEPFDEWPKTGHEAFPVLLSMCVVLRMLAAASDKPLDLYLMPLVEIPSPVLFVREVVEHLSQHGRLGDQSGISGTGKLFELVGDVAVFDPWVLRDYVRKLVETHCNYLLSDRNSIAAFEFEKYLKAEFGIEVSR